MAILINASIDLAKIDKSKIIEKDGKKYLNLTVSVNDEVNQYNQNVSISVAQSKDEKGQPKTYLGNGRVVWENGVMPKKVETSQSAPTTSSGDDDLPF